MVFLLHDLGKVIEIRVGVQILDQGPVSLCGQIAARLLIHEIVVSIGIAVRVGGLGEFPENCRIPSPVYGITAVPDPVGSCLAGCARIIGNSVGNKGVVRLPDPLIDDHRLSRLQVSHLGQRGLVGCAVRIAAGGLFRQTQVDIAVGLVAVVVGQPVGSAVIPQLQPLGVFEAVSPVLIGCDLDQGPIRFTVHQVQTVLVGIGLVFGRLGRIDVKIFASGGDVVGILVGVVFELPGRRCLIAVFDA